MEIEVVPVTGKTDATSVEKSTTVIIPVFKVSDYRQADLSMRIDQKEYPYTLQRDASLSLVLSLHASFRLYRFDYLSGALSATLYPHVYAKEVNARSKDGSTVVQRSLIIGPRVLLLDVQHLLKLVGQFHVEVDL